MENFTSLTETYSLIKKIKKAILLILIIYSESSVYAQISPDRYYKPEWVFSDYGITTFSPVGIGTDSP